MRFITEFELSTPFEIKNYKSLRERGSAEWLGLDIAKALGWKIRGETTMQGPIAERHTLEIEAFPMDKWLEFRNNIIAESRKGRSNRTNNIIKMIEDLESLGKPEHYEQSKSSK